MHDALEKYFGYTSFRPLQESIIRDILAKKDVFVLMPTGGGKSLCFQLPSVMMSGTTIVISPLISLMKDQVDALKQNGIAAEFLNSSQTPQEQADVFSKLQTNALKLLYVAPERLVLPGFLDLLGKISLNFFAIDEAHCISQWGHDFRPEYRQLKILRQNFPNIAIMALTATATTRVKEDIILELSLHNPSRYQASFDRPNLVYYVYPKQNTFKAILSFIEEHKNESGIIYCQSRKEVDTLTRKLLSKNKKAAAYHAGLADEERKKNQDNFLKENTDIIVATIAFGMGIDKSNVRYIIHYGLPKSIENYYQETGRAGRDNLPSTCIFFFSIGDMFFYDRFIAEKESKEEQFIAKRHLQHVVQYAQSKICRRKQLLSYFEEEYVESNCKSCDNCIAPKETFDGTIIAQKILSCVYRVQQKFGANHIAEVLLGSQSEKITKWNHQKLSTFNIVSEYTPSDLKMFIYELMQLGYLTQSDDQYGLLQLTNKSKSILQGKEKVFLTQVAIKPIAYVSAQDSQVDKKLFEELRMLRKQIAQKLNVPPYVVFSDATLKEMCVYFPQDETQFANIHGVGAEKLKKYGTLFTNVITKYCQKEEVTSPQWIPIKKL